jgi:hypothetical protein
VGVVFPSWSHRRGKVWNSCRRQWFYYYATKDEDQKLTRKLWLLKQLSTPEMLTGNLVEREIRRCLFEFKSRQIVPIDIECRIANASSEFRRILIESPEVVARMRKNQEPLRGEVPMHHEFYGESCDTERVQRCEQKVRSCISNWYSGDIWNRLQGVPVNDWMLVLRPQAAARNLNGWNLDGIKVWSPIDFHFRQDGKFHILDWKSGTSGDHSEQLAVYALYALKHRGQQVASITTQAVLLPKSANFDPHPVSELEVECIEAAIKSQVEAERLKLTEGKGSDGRLAMIATIDDFPAEPDVEKCKKCSFRVTCKEGLAWLNRPLGKELRLRALPLTEVEEVPLAG